MNVGVIIKSVGIYHPENKVDNQYFVEHFSEIDQTLGEKVSHLLNHLGRKERFIADISKENVITMAIEASKNAIHSADIKIEELDGVIFSTDTPEYTSPTNAIILRDALGAENAHTVFDMNANCVGMVVALDQAQALMKSNKRLHKLLVVGATMIHHYGLETNPITYGCIGDAAVAVVLEAIETEKPVGFIDSLYATKTNLRDYVLMPECGMSKIYNAEIPGDQKRWKWDPFDTEEPENRCAEIIYQLMIENNYTMEQAKMVFFTQFSETALKKVADTLNYPQGQFKYVGDRYAYTGTSSPLLAYYHAVTAGEIAAEDLLVFCSVGSGLTAASVLYISA